MYLVYSVGSKEQFLKVDYYYSSQGVPYEYSSLMHYKADAYSSNGHYTILPLTNVPITVLGESDLPTKFDYLHINLLYCKGGKCLLNTTKFGL